MSPRFFFGMVVLRNLDLFVYAEGPNGHRCRDEFSVPSRLTLFLVE